MSVEVRVEFGGGLAALFGDVSSLSVAVPGDSPSLAALVATLRDSYIKDRPDLFLVEDRIRPGIVVLINDTDWELEGTYSYILQPNDTITFISTLHGG